MTRREAVERAFPRLSSTGYQLTSPLDPTYNCIGWAAGDQDAWWWPVPSMTGAGVQGGYYWPPSAPVELTVDAFVAAYRAIGYRECDGDSLEAGYEKVAIYANADEAPTHAAHQLPNGRWQSKLGKQEDIEHDAVDHVGGTSYGEVRLFMRRKIHAGRPHPRAHPGS